MKKKHIPLATPHMSEEGYELEYVQDAFRKNWIAPLGENVNGFEAALCGFTGAPHAVALSSGTAALHLALLLLGVGAGDTVFCQDLTFAATANPIAYCGAKPVFIDSEEETWNMSPAALERAFHEYGAPKAVIVVHLYGNPAKMDELLALCTRYGTVLIEDAAEALGSVYRGIPCGALCRFGALSFNGNKIITTSGGGALLCGDGEEAGHALKLATQAREPFPWYEHEEIGYNYRLSNIAAGIGRGQMRVLQQRVEKKQAIYAQYLQLMKDVPVLMQQELSGTVSNRWLSALLLPEGGPTPDEAVAALRDADIEARHMWKPMHMQPVFADAPFVSEGETAVSEKLFSRGLCLPSDTKLTEEDIGRVAETLKSLFFK